MAAYTAGYAWSSPHTDTADELLRAYEICRGIAYPLEGPFLGGAVHLGPAWFYLTAIPICLTSSWVGAALFIGFVCSLKFPLAYYCGGKLLDREFGLLFAAAMFIPGWSSFEQLIFLNPNGVAAASLAVVALSLHLLSGGIRLRGLFVLGLACGLAIHVHPNSLPTLLLAVWVLCSFVRRGGAPLSGIVAMAAGFLFPFAPYILSQVLNGFPDWRSADAYMTRQISFANAVHAPAVIRDYLVTGPKLVASYFLGASAAAANALGVAAAIAALTSGLALLNYARRLLVWFVAALLVFAAWIACARPNTPLQFTWALTPAMGALIGLGFGRWRGGLECARSFG